MATMPERPKSQLGGQRTKGGGHDGRASADRIDCGGWRVLHCLGPSVHERITGNTPGKRPTAPWAVKHGFDEAWITAN